MNFVGEFTLLVADGWEDITATLDDAIDNNTRLVLANERAVQANLRRLVEVLYALPDRPVASSRR